MRPLHDGLGTWVLMTGVLLCSTALASADWLNGVRGPAVATEFATLRIYDIPSLAACTPVKCTSVAEARLLGKPSPTSTDHALWVQVGRFPSNPTAQPWIRVQWSYTVKELVNGVLVTRLKTGTAKLVEQTANGARPGVDALENAGSNPVKLTLDTVHGTVTVQWRGPGTVASSPWRTATARFPSTPGWQGMRTGDNFQLHARNTHALDAMLGVQLTNRVPTGWRFFETSDTPFDTTWYSSISNVTVDFVR